MSYKFYTTNDNLLLRLVSRENVVINFVMSNMSTNRIPSLCYLEQSINTILTTKDILM